jgi:hypothetical protein
MLETMSTTVRDASLTTARRRQIALYGYHVTNTSQALPGPEQAPSYGNQGTGPSADVVTAVTVGGFLVGQSSAACVCDSSVTLAGYAKSNAVTNGRNNA